MLEILQLMYVQWLSHEREKYIWEDLYAHSWDEIIGRMYLLKAHQSIECRDYQDALTDFEQALSLLAKDDLSIRRGYYAHALADKALVQCFLGQYDTALATLDQALAVADESERNDILNNRGANLVLVGAFEEALNALHTQLEQDPRYSWLRFTLATCLLHLERYQEAVVAYEQVIAERGCLQNDVGLVAARQGLQPDWANL